MVACVGRRMGVFSSCKFSGSAFNFAEAGAQCANVSRVVVFLVSQRDGIVLILIDAFAAPFGGMVVCLVSGLFTTGWEGSSGTSC